MRKYNHFLAHPIDFAATVCDGCRRDIPISENRHHCLDCDSDYCLVCISQSPGAAGAHNPSHDVALYPGLKSLDPDQRIELTAELRSDLINNQRFRGSATFFSRYALAIIDGDAADLGLPDEMLVVAREVIERIILLKSMGRFVDYFARRTLAGASLSGSAKVFSQGVNDTNRWKHLPLLKGVHDFALYPALISRIAPATFFEFGAEAGGSALWFADLTISLGIECHIYSMDLSPPKLNHERITFIEGDSNKVEEAFPASLLRDAPHPWIIVEDSHVNIGGILEYFSRFMQKGDYFIVEDDLAESEIGKYLLAHPRRYMVDTDFTDYFGYNATCSPDQILCFRE